MVFLALAACGVALLFLRPGWMRSAKRTRGWEGQGVPPARTLHFPNDYSLGTLRARDWGSTNPKAWEVLGPAECEVRIPAGKELSLSVSLQPRDTIWKKALRKIGIDPAPPRMDLSGLSRLGPNDLQGLGLEDGRLGDGDLKYVGRLTGLQRLTFPQMWRRRYGPMPDFTDEGIRHLAGLTNLRRIWFDSFITDSSLQYFTSFTLIEELDLRGTDTEGPGLVHLAKLPRLKKLSLSRRIKGEGAKPLLEFRSLEELIIGEGKYDSVMDDEGLKYLRNLHSLRRLAIMSDNIKGPGLKYLGEITSLEELHIHSRGLLIPGNLGGLKNLKNLRHLEIYSRVPDDSDPRHPKEAESLRQALPNCDFEWAFGVG